MTKHYDQREMLVDPTVHIYGHPRQRATLLEIAAELARLATEDMPEPYFSQCKRMAAELRDLHDSRKP